jgi:hypothetical protein
MKDLWILIGLLVVLAGLLVMRRLKDRRYLSSRTADVLSPRLREEIEKERGGNLEKRKRFEEAMKKAGES